LLHLFAAVGSQPIAMADEAEQLPPLLRVPAEIRTNIYHFVFCPYFTEIEAYSTSPQITKLPRGHDFPHAILLICQTIYEEVRNIAPEAVVYVAASVTANADQPFAAEEGRWPLRYVAATTRLVVDETALEYFDLAKAANGMPLLNTVEIYPAVLSYPSYFLSQMPFKVKQADIPKAKIGIELLRTQVAGFGRPCFVDAYQWYFADYVSHHAPIVVTIIGEADIFVDSEGLIKYVLVHDRRTRENLHRWLISNLRRVSRFETEQTLEHEEDRVRRTRLQTSSRCACRWSFRLALERVNSVA
jgi:hypothetical protein